MSKFGLVKLILFFPQVKLEGFFFNVFPFFLLSLEIQSFICYFRIRSLYLSLRNALTYLVTFPYTIAKIGAMIFLQRR